MGRVRAHRKGPNKPSKEPLPASASQPPLESLLEKAQVLTAQYNYDLARKFLTRILERDPNHVEAREMLGLVEIEDGDPDVARKIFASLVPPSLSAPSPTPYAAYLYLAQLSEENPNAALDFYQKGLDLLTSRLKGKAPAVSDSIDESELKKLAVRTITAMVEIWMSDLCFEPQAESQCEVLLKAALDMDSSNPEALQSLASVRVSQQRPDEAKALANQSWNLWKDLETDDNASPPIQTRLSLVRLFVELGLYSSALEVLQGILTADDQEVEAWYLRGWCFYLIAKAVIEGEAVEDIGEITPVEIKQDARNCLEMSRDLHQAAQHPDAQILEHVVELINELEAEGVHVSSADEAAEDDGVADDDEWTDDGSDVDMS